MTLSLHVLIVDDEPPARDELAFLLEGLEGVQVRAQAGHAREAMEQVGDATINLAFLDLRMPGPDGLALAELLHNQRPELPIVMVSAHDEGALKAFDAGVVDYLLKPVRLERLKRTIERVRAQLAQVPPGARRSPATPQDPLESQVPLESREMLDRLAVRCEGGFTVLAVSDIAYFEMGDELVWAVTDGDRFSLDLSLSQLEAQLPWDVFFRCHRSAIVRIDRIRSMEAVGNGTYELVLDHPSVARLPLARDRTKLLRQHIPVGG